MKQKSWMLLAVVVVVLLILIISISRWMDNEPPIISEPDFSNHPIYSQYNFGQKDRVVDIGIQPIWIPTSVITEAIKRDAVLKQAFSKLGLEIRFHPFLKGADVNYFLKSGHLDVGIAGDMPALIAAAEANVLIPVLIQQGFCSIVAKKHMLMTELRGRRIGYAWGSNAHYALLLALSHVGLTENDVHLVAMDVNQMPEALDHGQIVAFSAWEPTPSIALNKFSDQVIIHKNLSTGYLYFSRSFVQQHPEATRHIVAAEVRALKWMQSESQNLLKTSEWALESAADLYGQSLRISAEQIANLARLDVLGVTTVPFIPRKSLSDNGALHREFEFLKRFGMISATSKWDNIRTNFDRQILTKIVAKPNEYRLHQFEYEFDE